jgi:hypothetical protein
VSPLSTLNDNDPATPQPGDGEGESGDKSPHSKD